MGVEGPRPNTNAPTVYEGQHFALSVLGLTIRAQHWSVSSSVPIPSAWGGHVAGGISWKNNAKE